MALRNNIIESAEEVHGTKWVGGRKKKHFSWCIEELRNLVKHKEKKMRFWFKRRTPESILEYVEAMRNVNRETERAKKIF